MRILITGLTGFVGGHLAETLLTPPGAELYGFSRTGHFPDELLHLKDRVALQAVSYDAADSLRAQLREIAPEQVYHLAGFAHPGKSKAEPEAAFVGNVGVTRNLLEAIRDVGIRPRILFVSTGLVYGSVEGSELVCDESTPLNPQTPYAASKAAAEEVCVEMGRQGLDILRVRSFNQIGPRQTADYAAASFARQVARIEAGLQEPLLNTGDLSSQRDMTDVRDLVGAYLALMVHGHSGEVYNAGSGQTFRIRQLVDGLIAHATTAIEVRENFNAMYRADTSVSRADIRKLRSLTGWASRFSLEESLRDILSDWRERVARLGDRA